MNSTGIGNEFENKIYSYFKSLIDSGQFWANSQCCKLFRKKGYYSKDRGSSIVFDVSIEIYLPEAQEYSSCVIFECKNYSHSVPINDVEEFFAKVQQVCAANSKAVLVSNATFQKGTMAFAKSKGIGLFRYMDSSNYKWVLQRSFSARLHTFRTDSAILVECGLSDPDFISEVFYLYFQSPLRLTNSVYDFLNDILLEKGFTFNKVSQVVNQQNRLSSQVQYLEKGTLEELSTKVLNNIKYNSGKVDLELLCANEQKRCSLQVFFHVPLRNHSQKKPVLGDINFNPLQINIYEQAEQIYGRERFTLAHELAHHFLQHGQYMERESCDEGDFILQQDALQAENDISRMEFQANYFAASLLMPAQDFSVQFCQILRYLGISDKGFGTLYVDNQPCNFHNFDLVISQLTQHYGVSKSAAKIRLEGLELLRDTRANPVKSRSDSIFTNRFCKE
jgi:Zn-dependent peptidase ImmA (M78 family)